MPNQEIQTRIFIRNNKLVWCLFIVLTVVLLFKPNIALSQEIEIQLVQQDSVYRYFPAHSPAKATWMSAALPGLGQYYNGKKWKIPIVYAGFSTIAFFVMQNRSEYEKYKTAHALEVETVTGEITDNVLVNTYNESQLLAQREYYQSNLELSYILSGAFYILQIVDAAVDAHLYDYDIDEDLSIQFEPQLIPTVDGPRVIPGICIRWTIPKE